MEAPIIQLYKKPFSREKFQQREEAKIVDIKQRNCTHKIQVDDEDENGHVCELCGKKFNSNDVLLYMLKRREVKTEIESYNLRNEINFLTEKRDSLLSEIKQLQKDKRQIKKM